MVKKSEQNTDSKENSKNVSESVSLTPKSDNPDLLDDDKTKHAVEDIEKRDSDTVLEAEEGKEITPQQRTHNKRIFNNKKLYIPILIVLLVLIALLVPWSRYKLLGLALKQDFKVQIIDSQTLKPVSDATVILDNKTITTNNQGQATFHVKVGYGTLLISKKYYDSNSQKVLVGLKSGPLHNYKLRATGRQVPLSVVDRLNSQPVPNVMIEAAGTKAETDQHGKANIVLPANKSTAPATLSGAGYNANSATIKITASVVAANKFKVTPAGRIYFLSNASGTIDVINTNLDGTSRHVTLFGTGNEDPQNTQLLASRDWKYLALLATRDSSQNPKLYLITTNSDANSHNYTTIGSTNGTYTPVGWIGHNFIYILQAAKLNNWQNSQQVLKSYNADSGATTTLDQTTASGSTNDNYTGQEFGYGDTFITNGQVIYVKEWQQGYAANPSAIKGKQDQIIITNTNATYRGELKSFAATSAYYQYINALNYDPTHIYYQVSNSSGNTYYDYTNGSVTQTNVITDKIFNNYSQNYSIFLLSPSGKQTFWSEQRDGKNSIFIGDASGNNAKQIAPLSDYTPYGWYGDKYLLVEKNGNEIYAMSLDGKTVTKISDYYKPPQNIYGGGGGGGGGYGGL